MADYSRPYTTEQATCVKCGNQYERTSPYDHHDCIQYLSAEIRNLKERLNAVCRVVYPGWQ